MTIVGHLQMLDINLNALMHVPAVVLPRDLSVDEAIELGRRAIYHATFRDCASGGTVSGELALAGTLHSPQWTYCQQEFAQLSRSGNSTPWDSMLTSTLSLKPVIGEVVQPDV